MLKHLLIFVISVSVFFSNAQTYSYEKLVGTIDTCSTDSIFFYVDQSIDYLKFNNGSKEDLKEVVELKIYLSDSLSNTVMKESSCQEYLNIIGQDSVELYYTYMRKYGNAQYDNGKIVEAMDTYFSTLTYLESLKRDTLAGDIYNIIGVKYKNQNNAELSIKYLNEAIRVRKSLHDSIGVLNSYMTLGNAYKLLREKDSSYNDTALYYYEKSLEMAEAVGDSRGMAGNYNNIGNVYRWLDQTDKSMDFYFKALDINMQTGNKKWASYNYHNIASAYQRKNNNATAIQYFEKSLALKEELNNEEALPTTLQALAEAYARAGRYKDAYTHIKRAENLINTFQSANQAQMALELEAKFQNEKKAAEINALKAEQSLQKVVIDSQQKDLDHQEALRKKEKNLIYALGFILLSLIVTVIVFWRNNQQRKKHTLEVEQKNREIEKANIEIDKAKQNLEQKNQEVTDSINYAKRIQAAILPSESTLSKHLNNAFVFYLPKDIVAGDFYWTDKVGDYLLFAVADCTGHGVPGAMVSVICSNALGAATRQMNLKDPAEILEATTQLFKEKFAQSDESMKDGMDIALCSFNTKTRVFHYAGAHMPLWLVRDGEVHKTTATRRPVGQYVNAIPFESNEIELKKGDFIYLSSDGYIDQFGGEIASAEATGGTRKGKKFLNKRFRELLINISQLSIQKQKEIVEKTFTDWKSHYEQVDDVCIMGVQVDE